jgi:cytoskeletal protein CcmA (bactofilin family)
LKAIAFLALSLASLSAAAVAQQTELGGKVRSGQEVTVPTEETVRGDLIASAGTVRIDGRVDGDLVASGGQVTVAGTVTGDVLVAAGTTTISGQVDGDVRVASGQARLEGRVGEDVLLAVGQATVVSGARVDGDLIFGAGQMTMDGAVAGSVLGATRNYTRRGSVGGSEKVTVQQRGEKQAPTLADRAFDRLRRYASILAIGVLMLWLVPRLFRGAADSARGRPLVSFGVGILGVIGVIVLLVLVILVTVLVAIALGLLGLGSLSGATVFAGILAAGIISFLFFLAVAFGAQATVGLALGRLLFRGAGRSFVGGFGALALGVLVVVLISAIPAAGGLLEALLVLLGLGALVLMLRPGRRQLAEQPG